MQALIYTADEWCDAEPAEQQAVVDWINTLDLPGGRIANLLHHAGRLTAEYIWWDHSPITGAVLCMDVSTCQCTDPPPEFFVVSRRLDQGSVEVDALAEMSGAWRALSWQMVLEAGRRLRLWF